MTSAIFKSCSFDIFYGNQAVSLKKSEKRKTNIHITNRMVKSSDFDIFYGNYIVSIFLHTIYQKWNLCQQIVIREK